MAMRSFAVFVVFVCFAACAAFDEGAPIVTDVNPEGNPNVVAGSSGVSYEGYYVGSKALEKNACQKIGSKLQKEEKFELEIVQSGDKIGLTFEDGSSAPGVLKENKTTILVKQAGYSSIYMLSFSKEGVEGSIDVVESISEGQLDAACATYKVQAEKGTKPAKGAE